MKILVDMGSYCLPVFGTPFAISYGDCKVKVSPLSDKTNKRFEEFLSGLDLSSFINEQQDSDSILKLSNYIRSEWSRVSNYSIVIPEKDIEIGGFINRILAERFIQSNLKDESSIILVMENNNEHI